MTPGSTDCKMMKTKEDICPCIMEKTLRFLGKSWNIMIIGTIGNYQQLRYVELKEKLGKISPKTLATRLKELVSIGIINRKPYAEIPPRVEYCLTAKGRELHNRLLPLLEWAKADAYCKS